MSVVKKENKVLYYVYNSFRDWRVSAGNRTPSLHGGSRTLEKSHSNSFQPSTHEPATIINFIRGYSFGALVIIQALVSNDTLASLTVPYLFVCTVWPCDRYDLTSPAGARGVPPAVLQRVRTRRRLCKPSVLLLAFLLKGTFAICTRQQWIRCQSQIWCDNLQTVMISPSWLSPQSPAP